MSEEYGRSAYRFSAELLNFFEIHSRGMRALLDRK